MIIAFPLPPGILPEILHVLNITCYLTVSDERHSVFLTSSQPLYLILLSYLKAQTKKYPLTKKTPINTRSFEKCCIYTF